jgi:hypothetical protein
MAFTDIEQQEMITEISTHQAVIGLVSISVEFSLTSEPVMFADGSYEVGKPYCVATSRDVLDNAIVHGTMLTIDTVAWYVIGIQKKRSGFQHLTLSKNHE